MLVQAIKQLAESLNPISREHSCQEAVKSKVSATNFFQRRRYRILEVHYSTSCLHTQQKTTISLGCHHMELLTLHYCFQSTLLPFVVVCCTSIAFFSTQCATIAVEGELIAAASKPKQRSHNTHAKQQIINMSWFSGGLDMLNDLKNNVEASVKNNIDPELIKKLTLQSDELVSERERIDNEERRKEAVRDSLAEILPWETRDAEMEILVDECKEVILALSSNEDTFTGPFVLAGGLPSGEGGEEVDEVDEDAKAAMDLSAAELSADKLSKLQPLPELLSEFDLDTHVGLIEKVLKVDEHLTRMHSRLSSGGERERIFWKNYFFHCAYSRYEAGLSIDEIWCPEQQAKTPVALVEQEVEDYDVVNNSDEEVIFDSASSAAGSRESSSHNDKDNSSSAGGVSKSQNIQQNTKLAGESLLSSTTTSPPPKVDVVFKSDPLLAQSDSVGGNDYEFVPSSAGGDDELDELEAEIAAALDD